MPNRDVKMSNDMRKVPMKNESLLMDTRGQNFETEY